MRASLSSTCEYIRVFLIVSHECFPPAESANKPGPRLVMGNSGYVHGGQCQRGNSPITPRGAGGLSAGNQGGTSFVGTEGWQIWDIFSDDGSTFLGCTLKASFRKPFWGVVVDSYVRWTLEGAGCEKPPLKGGPAPFQEHYDLQLQVLDENVSPPQGWSRVNIYYDSKKSDSKDASTPRIWDNEEQICTNGSDTTWYQLLTDDIQGQDLGLLQGQSYISAQDAAVKADPEFLQKSCTITKPELSQICVALVNFTGYTAVEYQYEATASYDCDDVLGPPAQTFKSHMYNLYQ